MEFSRAGLLLTSAALVALTAGSALAQQVAANDQTIETVTVLGKAIYVAGHRRRRWRCRSRHLSFRKASSRTISCPQSSF